MTVDVFIEEIKERVAEAMGENYRVDVDKYKKNNGVMIPGINIQRKGENIGPVIYLDEFFKQFGQGEDELDEIAEKIIILFSKSDVGRSIELDFLTDYAIARTNLRGRLINTEKNEELLKSIPHREFFDLSLVYFVEMEHDFLGSMSISVRNQTMEQWGVSENDLYQEAMKNTFSAEEGKIINMTDYMKEHFESEIWQEIDADKPKMLILTNKNQNYGAVQMLDKELIRKAGDIFRDDFIILPSSVHEVLAFKLEKKPLEKETYLGLKKMVKEVNDNCVVETERLSYNIYRYYRDTDSIGMVYCVE